MKNFQVTSKEDGKKYWISRACAITAIVIAKDYKTGRDYFLVSKRGPGCPDYVGKWAFTCGYLDWDETLEDAVKRELWEELGYKVPDQVKIDLWEMNSDPNSDERQNVCFRYIVRVSYDDIVYKIQNNIINTDTESRGGEPNEVSEIKLIPVEDTELYEWAFNHSTFPRLLPKESGFNIFKKLGESAIKFRLRI